jgi:hypothetical protein
MAEFSFAVKQHPDGEAAEKTDRFFFEVLETGRQRKPSILCEVRACESQDEFEIIVWKGDQLVLGGERFPRKSLEDLAQAIQGIL